MRTTSVFKSRAILISTTVPAGLLQRCDNAGIARSDALKRGIEVLLAEKETGVNAAKQSSPAATTTQGVST